MPSRQKAKGNNYERWVAMHLSEIFDLNFTRVPTSGAMTGGMNADVLKRLSHSQKLLLEGDLIPPDELYYVKIECKSLKSLNFSSLLKECAIMNSWIDQARSDEKMWFLFFKINNRGNFIAFNSDVFEKCNILGNYLMYKGNYITPLDGFFESNRDTILNWYAKTSDI